MTTLVWGYLDEYEAERADILDAVDTVFRSGTLVLGGSVRAFEAEYAGYHGVPHCIGLDNGTNAIKLGLQALGVGPGDEVITVANTAAPTVVAIAGVGAAPVFVDVDPQTCLMDPALVAAAVTPRTRALVPVHLFGQCASMAPLLELARRHGLGIVEDCAQAHGARQHGRLAGTMGTVGAFSFYPTKVLGTYGDGGAVTTADDAVAARIRRLRYYGMAERYYVVDTPGHNSRLDELHAEILRRKLRRLDGYLAARRAVADRYRSGLKDTDLGLPEVAEGNEHAYHLFVVRHPRRDAILAAMRGHDIELAVHYRWPVHTMSGFDYLGYPEGALPVTERLAGEVFSLPMYPSLPIAVQERVIDALRLVLAKL